MSVKMDSEGNCIREPGQPAVVAESAEPKFMEVNPWIRRCRPLIGCLCFSTSLYLIGIFIFVCIYQAVIGPIGVVFIQETLILLAAYVLFASPLAIMCCCACYRYRTQMDYYRQGIPMENGLPVIVHPLAVHDTSTGGAQMVVHPPAPEFPMEQHSGQFNDPPPPYSNVVTEPFRTDISGRVSPYHMSPGGMSPGRVSPYHMSQKEQIETYPAQANPPSYPYNPYNSSPYRQTQGSYLPLYDPLLSPGRTSPGGMSPGGMSPGRTSPGRASPYHLSPEEEIPFSPPTDTTYHRQY